MVDAGGPPSCQWCGTHDYGKPGTLRQHEDACWNRPLTPGRDRTAEEQERIVLILEKKATFYLERGDDVAHSIVAALLWDITRPT